jgi:hypothetical protein
MKTFLEGVIPASQPWVSSQDTRAGSAWFGVLTKELKQSDYGLFCLTERTAVAPWIAFEAGAISLKLGEERVCPYLLDVEISHLRKLGLPYHLFNAVSSSKDGTQRLVDSIVSCLPEDERVEDRRIRANFRVFWPDLWRAITAAKKGEEPPSESEKLLAQIKIQHEQSLEAMDELHRAKLDALVSMIKDIVSGQIRRIDQ